MRGRPRTNGDEDGGKVSNRGSDSRRRRTKRGGKRTREIWNGDPLAGKSNASHRLSLPRSLTLT
ncbi:unnamed protein product [Spirodela intermedia]|uniref:Uncharacterized protein n=1 Tax=Spirodela intermedia TaxID=51605 RepID=A0ABN7EBV8_SPIIN|nr:unnamed protein product [Spirodela intermedia]